MNERNPEQTDYESTIGVQTFILVLLAISVGTLAAVVLVPPNAPPCSAAAVPREVTLPLAAPLGQRTVLVVPPGTEVPQPNSPS